MNSPLQISDAELAVLKVIRDYGPIHWYQIEKRLVFRGVVTSAACMCNKNDLRMKLKSLPKTLDKFASLGWICKTYITRLENTSPITYFTASTDKWKIKSVVCTRHKECISIGNGTCKSKYTRYLISAWLKLRLLIVKLFRGCK